MNGLPSADNATRVIAPQFNPFNVWKEQVRLLCSITITMVV
jgi:hypothetical protein